MKTRPLNPAVDIAPGWRYRTDALQFIVERPIKHGDKPRKEDARDWRPVGYFSTFDSMIRFLASRMTVARGDCLDQFNAMAAYLDACEGHIKAMCERVGPDVRLTPGTVGKATEKEPQN